MTEIRIENMSFGYSASHLVLRDINLSLTEPGLYCIIGPNGVGKSTLIRCINKLSSPTSGEVFVNGRNVKEYSLKELSKFMGYVPVKTNDVFSMNVIDTILVGRNSRSKWRTTAEDMDAVEEVMRLMGIEDLALCNFNELSAGQHQKIAIARGLVQEPEILILDEPTSNLDVRHQIYVTQLLRAIAEEKKIMILMISHDLNIASKYAHQIIVMSAPGIILKHGEPNDVIDEETIEKVYGVKCQVTSDEGRPLVILKSELPEL